MSSVTKRPVHLNVLQIKLPIAGIMSILHRVTGALMALAIPFMIYLLDLALEGEQGFAAAGALLDGVLMKLVIFALVWAVLHHLLAGIRYLLIDVHVGVEKPVYRQTAWVAVIAAPLLAVAFTGMLL
jgi:succinate dehydrogenase / fumarate reductase cytochrome b subunit